MCHFSDYTAVQNLLVTKLVQSSTSTAAAETSHFYLELQTVNCKTTFYFCRLHKIYILCIVGSRNIILKFYEFSSYSYCPSAEPQTHRPSQITGHGHMVSPDPTSATGSVGEKVAVGGTTCCRSTEASMHKHTRSLGQNLGLQNKNQRLRN